MTGSVFFVFVFFIPTLSVDRVEATENIHLPLVDRVEAFKTHIYSLYVQFATKMLRVDGVGGIWGGGNLADEQHGK